jgi:hypothetical protein
MIRRDCDEFNESMLTATPVGKRPALMKQMKEACHFRMTDW